jgi:hypothetical protein
MTLPFQSSFRIANSDWDLSTVIFLIFSKLTCKLTFKTVSILKK